MIELRGIPILNPPPLFNDPCAPRATPQPILQLKELSVDVVRHQEWKAFLQAVPRAVWLARWQRREVEKGREIA